MLTLAQILTGISIALLITALVGGAILLSIAFGGTNSKRNRLTVAKVTARIDGENGR